MANGVIADGHIRDLANRADTGATRILWRQQDSETYLRETTPTVLHNVAIDQNALRVFQFEEIFYNERIPVCSPHESALPFHPGERLEHVILSNLNISRRCSGRVSAEQDVLP